MFGLFHCYLKGWQTLKAIAHRIGAIFARFQAREADVESESRATGKARVSRSTTASCLPEKREKMVTVLHGGCHGDICNDPHSLECE